MPDRTESFTKEKSTEKDANRVPDAARKLAEEFGLTVSKSTQNGNRGFVFSLPAEDCAEPSKTISQGADLKAIKEDLTRKRDAFIDRIELEHPVDILEEGEHLNTFDKDGKPLKADVRTPNFSQLTKVENALERSLPQDEDKSTGIIGWFKELFDDDRLVIGFAAKDTDSGASARYFQGDSAKGILPYIVIDPEAHDSESVILHELAHHGQAGFWNSDHPESQKWNDYTASLGWVHGNNRDLIMTNDAEPQLFHFSKENNPKKLWTRMNTNGEFLDAKGNIVPSEDKAEQISNAEMARRALVAPPNDVAYMNSPTEHGAELMMTLRQNETTRASLLRRNPHAYRIAVEVDQKEIDGKYGVDWSGQSRKIRSPNGEIVENNAKSRLELQTWESRNSQAPRFTPARNGASYFNPPTRTKETSGMIHFVPLNHHRPNEHLK